MPVKGTPEKDIDPKQMFDTNKCELSLAFKSGNNQEKDLIKDFHVGGEKGKGFRVSHRR